MATSILGLDSYSSHTKLSAASWNELVYTLDRTVRVTAAPRHNGVVSGWQFTATQSTVSSGAGVVGPFYCQTTASQVISGLANGTNYIFAKADGGAADSGTVDFVARASTSAIVNADGVTYATRIGHIIKTAGAISGVYSSGGTTHPRDKLATMSKNTLTLPGGLVVPGSFTLTGGLNVDGAVDFDSTLNVSGAATFLSSIGVSGNTTMQGTLTVSGALGVSGAVTFGGTLHAEGATDVDGTFNVSGAATFANTVGATGNVTLAAALYAGTASGISTTKTVVDSVRYSGAVLQYRTRTVTARKGVVTALATTGAWTAVPSA